MEVHTLNVNKEEPWNSMGMTHKVQVHSNYTTHKLYLFLVFVLFMRLLIYISTDWIFATAVNRPLFNSVWVYTLFLLSVKSPVSFCTPVAFFLISLAAELHIHLCKCNFYEKVFLYEENQNFVMIFINTKRTMRSVIHGTEVVLHASFSRRFPRHQTELPHTHTPESAGCTHSPRSRFTPIRSVFSKRGITFW